MSISLAIIAAATAATSSATSNGGTEAHVITDSEIREMRMDEAHVTQYGYQYMNSIKPELGIPFPDHGALKDPTPLGNLYHQYHDWVEVHTVATLESAEILEVTTENLQLDKQLFDNTNGIENATTTFTTTLNQSYSNTVSSTWSNSFKNTNSFTLSGNIAVEDVGGAGMEWSQSFEHSWGMDTTEGYAVTIGTATSVSVPLQRGQIAEAVLSATKGKIRIRAHYNASLRGHLFVNYPILVEGHHYWAYSIEHVFRQINKSNNFQFSEVIEIGYYFNGKVEVIDKTPGGSNSVISTNSAQVTPQGSAF